VVTHPGLQHQLRVAPYDVDRVELDAANVPNEGQDPGLASKPPGWEQVLMRQQEAARMWFA